ncbi:hypothetical protein ACFX2B_011176 [Malus domestica]
MGLRITSCGDDVLQFCRCLAASFFLNAALKQPDGTYRALANGEVVSIHPSSIIRNRPECLIYNELVETSRKFICNTTRIDFFQAAPCNGFAIAKMTRIAVVAFGEHAVDAKHPKLN